jgi:peptidyl-tRNA hydrolase
MTSVLYIIARNDLNSLNPGKLAAQASHASNAFVHHFHNYSRDNAALDSSNTKYKLLNKAFYEWENSTPQGCGTVLVLEGKMIDIAETVKIFSSMGYISGVFHDPTYPIVDGKVVHHIPLDTCAYIFVPNKEEDLTARNILEKYPLHR